jgi:hypothetical protein
MIAPLDPDCQPSIKAAGHIRFVKTERYVFCAPSKIRGTDLQNPQLMLVH